MKQGSFGDAEMGPRKTREEDGFLNIWMKWGDTGVDRKRRKRIIQIGKESDELCGERGSRLCEFWRKKWRRKMEGVVVFAGMSEGGRARHCAYNGNEGGKLRKVTLTFHNLHSPPKPNSSFPLIWVPLCGHAPLGPTRMPTPKSTIKIHTTIIHIL